jgi:cytoskeletal protein CcmA (bactofilin family)
MKSRAFFWASACLALAALPVFANHHEGPRRAEIRMGSDQFSAGSNVTVSTPVAGDLIAFGGSVDVSAPVNGDTITSGGNVLLNAPVGQSLFAAGGQLNINGNVARNARLAGGQINIGPNAEIGGNVSIGGGNVNIKGKIKGYLQAGAGSVLLNGPIIGDVVVTAGSLELGPNARIDGKLRYASREEIKRDAAAQVSGGIERMQPGGGWPVPAKMEHQVGRTGGWIWTAGLMVMAALLVAAMPGFYTGVSTALQEKTAMSLLIGFITLVCLPVAAIILFVTIIGIPLGLLALMLYPVLLLLGYVSTAIGLGDFALRRWRSTASTSLAWRVGAAVVAVLLLALLARIPWVGGFVVFAILISGLGALVMQLWRGKAAVPL